MLMLCVRGWLWLATFDTATESKREHNKEESTATTSGDEDQVREVRIASSAGDKPPAESDEGIILQGFLKKQTHSRFTKYKKRWCVLSADSLTYYENKVRPLPTLVLHSAYSEQC
jgi:hypothetical protein